VSAPRRILRLRLALFVALLFVAGCNGTTGPAETDGDAAGAVDTSVVVDAVTRVSEEGPVRAEVSLSPASPRLGDPLTLTLEVVAQAGVSVELPGFGEALGRFSIVDYTPRRELGPDGETIATQRYRLQAPMSGRQRIPPLRIEFIDERPGQVAAGDVAMPRELLTDEIPIEVASVLADGAVADELRPVRGELEEIRTGDAFRIAGWLLAAALLVAAALAWRAFRRHVAARRRDSAYAVAIARIDRLESRGLPTGQEADDWYVELSDIVRHYLENRYGVRAPELTTEEFLREAHRSAELTDAHRELMSGFLAICDRVKFAQYVPEEGESRDALATARQFLEETGVDRPSVDAEERPSAA